MLHVPSMSVVYIIVTNYIKADNDYKFYTISLHWIMLDFSSLYLIGG